MKKITVYSTRTCPYCMMLARWLRDQKMEFTEYKVDENPYAAQVMVNISGQMGVPFTTVEEADGMLTNVFGFDVPKLKTALGI